MDPFPEATFPRLLADLWRQQGWETDTARRGDSTYVVGGERDGGTRGLMLVLADPDAEVRTAHLRKFAKMCRTGGVDVAVVATQGTFTGEVRRVAGDRGIHLLDRDRLGATIREGGFEAVLRRHRDGTDGDDGATDADADADANASDVSEDADEGWQSKLRGALPDGARGAASALRAGASSNPKRVLAVVLAVAVLTSGVVIGVPTGGSGGGPSVAVSAVSTATPAASGAVTVRWNAETRSTLDPPGGTYEAPPNETFVVVRLDVTSEASDPVMFGGPRLIFESDGVRYGSQPLRGANLKTLNRFTSGGAGTVWAVFSVPANATTGTVLVRNGLAADGPRVRFVHDPSLTVEFDAPASEAKAATETAAPSGSSAETETTAASLDPVRAAVSAVDRRVAVPPPDLEAAVARRLGRPLPTQIINRPRP